MTLTVGNAYLQIIDAASRIEATDAQVRNAQALYGQAVDAFNAGTSSKIDVTRTSVQLHREQFNLAVARNNEAIAKLNLARAIGLPVPTRNSVWSPISTVRRMIRTPRVPSIHCSSRLILTSARTSFLLVFK